MIGVVLRVGMIFNDCAGLRERLVTHDEFLRTCFEVHVRHAASRRSHVVEKAVADARITITRAAIGHARKVAGNRFLTVRAERINRARNRALVTRFDIHDVADETILLTIVPDDLRFGSRDPLQHAALLPVPCPRGSQRDPSILFLQIHHAHFNHVIRRR